MSKHQASKGRHRVSFKDLLILKRIAKSELRQLEAVKDLIGLDKMPTNVLDYYVRAMNRVNELDAIKRDRFNESEKQQREMEAAENYRQNMAGI